MPNPPGRGLERGLDALLGRKTGPESGQGTFSNIALTLIDPGTWQPRRDFEPEKLEQLKASIRQDGVLQPILLRPKPDNRYELISGERRWRVSKELGLAAIPAYVRTLSDKQAAACSLVDNVQRADLNPVEQGEALARLIEDFGYSHEQVAAAVAMKRSSVTNLLRLKQLTVAVQDLLRSGQISLGHSKVLLGLERSQQGAYADLVVEGDLSVRQLEHAIKSRRINTPPLPIIGVDSTPSVTSLRRQEARMSEVLGTRVKVRGHRKGAVTVKFASLDDLIQMLDRLNRPD